MKRILIDAGHGIDTPGKRSPDGRFREYLWNREIADKVVSRLRSRFIDCELVAPETKDTALSTRVKRVNAVCDKEGKDNVLLVSIHSNASGTGASWMTAKGWSCYTSKGQTKSDSLAECMYDSFQGAFPDRKIRRDFQDGDSDYEENFYILKNTKCPAVLLENFFYDNREECEWLLREDTKVRIADAVVYGLMIYLSQIDY